MKKTLIVVLLSLFLLTACGGAAETNQEGDSGKTVTVYYSPT